MSETHLVEYEVVNSTDMITSTDEELITGTFSKLAIFSESIKTGLVDGVDYGLIPGTKVASLFLPGAEKIQLALGLSVEFDLENSVEDWQEGFFMYRFKASVFKGTQLVATGYGAANTKEGKYERQNPYTLQETVLLIAKKRAYVNGIRSASCLSSIFTQDTLDDQNSTANKLRADKTRKTKSGRVTTAQIKMFYAICGAMSVTKDKSDALLKEYGYNSAKEIEQTKFDEICKIVKEGIPDANRN